jgi:hypothetical protein
MKYIYRFLIYPLLITIILIFEEFFYFLWTFKVRGWRKKVKDWDNNDLNGTETYFGFLDNCYKGFNKKDNRA